LSCFSVFHLKETQSCSLAVRFAPSPFPPSPSYPRWFCSGPGRTQDRHVNPAKVFTRWQETKDLKQKMENDRQAIQAEGKRRADELERSQEGPGHAA